MSNYKSCLRVVAVALCLLSGMPAVAADASAAPAEPPGTPTVANFEKLVPGESDYQAIVSVLGRPSWLFDYPAEKDVMPLQPAATDTSALAVPSIDASKLETLRVLEYSGKWPRRAHFAVLRQGTLFYTIGPVPDDERKPESVEARYGKTKVETDRTLTATGVETVHVVWYRKRGIGFLRGADSDEYTAKIRFAPMPSGSRPRPGP
jgi:hypothetical protein